MRKLSKLTINELQNDSSEILSRERMKAIKGGGLGMCYWYCGNSEIAGPYDDCWNNPPPSGCGEKDACVCRG